MIHEGISVRFFVSVFLTVNIIKQELDTLDHYFGTQIKYR